MSELKECPFCGGVPDLFDATTHFGCWRLVHRCPAMGYLGYETSEKKNVVNVWNTRAPHQAEARMTREELVDVVRGNRHMARRVANEIIDALISAGALRVREWGYDVF